MTPKQLWADQVVKDCLLEAGGDVAAALEAAQYIVATQPVPASGIVLANVYAPDVLPLVQAAHEATTKALRGGHASAGMLSKMALDAAIRGKWSEALMHHSDASQDHNTQVVTALSGPRSPSGRHITARNAHITAARAILGPEGQKWEDAIRDAYPHTKKQELHNAFADWLEDSGFEHYAQWQRLIMKEDPTSYLLKRRGLTLPGLSKPPVRTPTEPEPPSVQTPEPLPPEGPADLKFKYSKVKPKDEYTLSTEDEPTHEELHEISWKAYDHGMKAVRSGDKEAHTKSAEMHREAAKHRTAAVERTKGHERDVHRKMAWAHESSAKMHDRAAKNDAALSIDDVVLTTDPWGEPEFDEDGGTGTRSQLEPVQLDDVSRRHMKSISDVVNSTFGRQEARHPDSRDFSVRGVHGRDIDIRYDHRLRSARINFPWTAASQRSNKVGMYAVPKEVRKGSMEFGRKLLGLVEGLHKGGIGIHYAADDHHSKAYENLLPRYGYEQYHTGMWRPAQTSSTAFSQVPQEMLYSLALDIEESDIAAALAIDKPGFHPMHHKVEAALDAQHLTPELRNHYNGAHYVLGRMSKTALDRLHAGTRKVMFHPNHESILSITDANIRNRLAGGGKVGGLYSPMYKELHQGPDKTSSDFSHPEVFGHEAFHAVSRGNGSQQPLHDHPEWIHASATDPHVSPYAVKYGPNEEFAEFGRLTHGSNWNLRDVARLHPLKSAFFKKHDLWPTTEHDSVFMQKPHIADLFSEALPMEDGGHADILKQTAPSVRHPTASSMGHPTAQPVQPGVTPQKAPPPLPQSSRRSAKIALSTEPKKKKRPIFKRVRAKKQWKPCDAKFATDEPQQSSTGPSVQQPKVGIFGRVKSALRPLARAASAGVSKVVTALAKPFTPAPTTPATDTRFHTKGKNIEHHTGKVRDALAKVGITEPWNTPWHESPMLRRHALVEPEKFDRLVQHINHHLTQATKFGANAEVMQRKIGELQQLQQAATKHREDMQLPVAQLLPEHYGRRGAAHKHIQAVLDHLEEGGDAKSAVAHLVQHGGLNQSSAKRYVLAAMKKVEQQESQKQVPPKQLPDNKTMWPGGPTLSE